MPELERLFDEFASRFARGERPDIGDYLARAGDGADELARLINAYLVLAPPGEPSSEDRARVLAIATEAGEEETLLGLRRRRGLTRDAVVDAIVTACSLDHARHAKVKRYYHELESGLLDRKGVSERVWTVLAKLLDAAPDRLRVLPGPPAVAAPALFRGEPEGEATAPSAPRAEPAEPDEVDLLFLSGR